MRESKALVVMRRGSMQSKKIQRKNGRSISALFLRTGSFSFLLHHTYPSLYFSPTEYIRSTSGLCGDSVLAHYESEETYTGRPFPLLWSNLQHHRGTQNDDFYPRPRARRAGRRSCQSDCTPSETRQHACLSPPSIEKARPDQQIGAVECIAHPRRCRSNLTE